MPDKMFSVFLLSFATLLLVLLYIRSRSAPFPPSPRPEPQPSPNPEPSPSPDPSMVGGCKGTRYGCCLDGKVACVDKSCSNCKGTGGDLKKK